VRVLVGYFSETGNTKRIAEAIGQEAEAAGHAVRVESTEGIDAAQLAQYDVVFLGSTCHSSDVAAPVQDILKGIPQGPGFELAGFVTHSVPMPDAGARQKEMYAQWAGKCLATFETACKEKGIGLLGFFHCQGAPNPQIELFIRNTVIPDETEWNEYIEDARKHPTPEDVESAKGFARGVLTERP